MILKGDNTKLTEHNLITTIFSITKISLNASSKYANFNKKKKVTVSNEIHLFLKDRLGIFSSTFSQWDDKS
jgi:hypothetical protein